ncbi:MAG TPA: hypothetical protein VMF62_09350 [Acetobacteraceae bacterium]|jgi:hypothetical protein|nr:hypothetical protein [Acetobacteraceae bacterium]
MLTLARFRAMAECYGEDLRRRPAESPADAMLCLPGGEDAALARLRARVAARIAAPPERRFGALKAAIPRPLPSLPPFGLGLAAGGGLAIMAGLLIGALYTAAPSSDSLLALLQPAPIHIFED